jgi:hypothetical protein
VTSAVVGSAGTTSLAIASSNITGNTGDGIQVDLNSATGNILSSTISGNTSHGIEVVRAPLIAGAVKLTMDGLTVSGNGGTGIWLRGNTGSIGASITNDKITGNTSTGLRIEQGLLTTTQETIQSNEISTNGGGGIQFNTASTLSSFVANLVHGNTGDQILVAARQTGNVAWNFRSPGATCDANRNQVYCYNTSGNPGTGIRLSAPLGSAGQVDARNMTWKAAAPSGGVDYVVITPPAANALDATLPCAAGPATCP